MSNLNISMSRNSVITVNGVNWSYQSGTFGISTKWANTSDNDSGKFEEEKAISETFNIQNLVAKRKTTINPHAAPLNISNQSNAETIAIVVWPDGLTGMFYGIPTFATKNFDITSNPKEGNEMSMSFSGNSTGPFTKPGQA